jgi:hypothetical protein
MFFPEPMCGEGVISPFYLSLDPTNPEDLYLAKDTLGFIHGHFRGNEIAYLMGEMDLEEAAEVSGCRCEAFRRNLDRRKADFRNAMKAVDC